MDKIDIMDLMHREGIELHQKGRDYWGLCPFHAEKTPSFKVSPERQAFYCFGCGEGGDGITFIMKRHNLSFKEAIRYLNIKGNSTEWASPEARTKRDLLKRFRTWEREYYGELADYYREFHDILKDCKTMEEVEDFADDFHLMPIVERHMDIMATGTDEQKYKLCREVTR